MENGWIKIHRKILKKGFWKKSNYVHLWLCLLLKVNHEPKEFMWNGKTIIIKEGQLLTGRKQLSQETGISETTVERILDFLEKECQIGQQKTTKYRLITIINWKEYQNTDNKRTTSGQQADTNKNVKNVKNVINKEIILPEWLNKDVWKNWVEYRKEKKQKLTPRSIAMQLKELEKDKEHHVEILEQSIRNGWTGLFPLKGDNKVQNNYKNTGGQSLADKLKSQVIK
jgi:hypothetical protein